MTFPDRIRDLREARPSKVPPGAWVALALVAGAAPWAGAGLEIVGIVLLP